MGYVVKMYALQVYESYVNFMPSLFPLKIVAGFLMMYLLMACMCSYKIVCKTCMHVFVYQMFLQSVCQRINIFVANDKFIIFCCYVGVFVKYLKKQFYPNSYFFLGKQKQMSFKQNNGVCINLSQQQCVNLTCIQLMYLFVGVVLCSVVLNYFVEKETMYTFNVNKWHPSQKKKLTVLICKLYIYRYSFVLAFFCLHFMRLNNCIWMYEYVCMFMRWTCLSLPAHLIFLSFPLDWNDLRVDKLYFMSIWIYFTCKQVNLIYYIFFHRHFFFFLCLVQVDLLF
eukprot:TRINITY_DN1297_c0_g1_i12.p2 TRINITY_DN1297_c0_g1~~TRINITY_DN1297_c0_g1_i12.p2  ORF type:complete len:282 (-),score=-13.14 TRINITY_DN1297_c0_g1_i12:646-1491(-)